MKRKFVGSLLLIGTLSILASCGEITGGTTVAKPSISSPQTTPSKPSEKVDFKATLTNNGSPFLLTDPEVKAVWQNTNETITADFDENSEATTKLDGEYYVHLSKCPKNYTYNPNVNIVTSENPNCNIELMRLAKPSKGKGTDLYNNIYQITDLNPSSVGKSYAFEATITSANDMVYFGFIPKVSGSYSIESMVDMLDNEINPKVLTFYPGSSNTAYPDQEVNSGGAYLDGGYTRNFKFQVDFTEKNIGNVAKFGIKAEKIDTIDYPVTIPFKITYEGSYDGNRINRRIMYAEEMYYKRDSNGNYIVDSEGNYELNYVKMTDEDKYYSASYDENHSTTFYNKQIDPSFVYDSNKGNKYIRRRFSLVNGSYVADPNGEYILKSTMKEVETDSKYQDFGNYNGFKNNGTGNVILDESRLIYNEDDGYYHFIDDNGIDRIVCAKIGVSISVFEIEQSFLHIEDEGDTCVSAIPTNEYDSETGLRIIENYKYFIEAEYADILNSDGVVYVNKEIKNFLQKLSNRASYFFDGNGWCEANGVFASEENQWLFACGFYTTR